MALPSSAPSTSEAVADLASIRIVDHIDVGVAIFGPDGRVLRWNRWLAARSGTPPAAAVGKRLDEIYPDLSGHLLVECIDQTLKAGMSAFLSHRLHSKLLPLRNRETDKDGPISQNIVIKLIEGSGNPRAAIMQVFDVSSTVHREAELRRRKRQLETARKVAEDASRAKSQFLTHVSHELRTPLNAVIGFSELLGSDKERPLDSEQAELVELIGTNGRRLLALIGDLLDLSRVEAGAVTLSVEPVDVSPLLLDLRQTLEPMARDGGIALHGPIPRPGRWTVKADRLRLSQILMNFGSNAIKYNRPRGQVTVSAEARGNGSLRIAVVDTGLGLTESQVARLFLPFSRLGQEHGKIEGTGVGLAISKHLAELMGATVGAESRVGAGSRFWIDLPLTTSAEDHGAPADRVEGDEETAEKDSITILYIEDNPANMTLMERILKRVKDSVLLGATNGPDGLMIAAEKKPQIVLLDIDLPDMNGFEVLRRLRADPATSAIPVIALSAAAMPPDIERGRKAGFFAYLTKPIDIPLLIETLGKARVGGTVAKGAI